MSRAREAVARRPPGASRASRGEWRIAAGVVCVVVSSFVLVSAGVAHAIVAVGFALAVFTLSAGAVLVDVWRRDPEAQPPVTSRRRKAR